MTHTFYTECTYFTAAKYTREITRIANHFFKPTDMPAAYSYILLTLEDYPALTITELSNILGYERSSLVRIINKLQKKNLIEITQVHHKNIFSLSSNSTKMLVLANKCLKEYSQYANQLFNSDVKSTLTTGLTAASKSLNTTNPDY